MTNQVNENVTASGEELSEEALFNEEWDKTDGKDQASGSDDPSGDTASNDSTENADQGKAEETTTSGETVATGTPIETPDKSNDPAEGSEEDIWESATNAQKLAFKKAQNDFNRESGRAKSQQQRNAQLERDLLAETRKYTESVREKGEYELEHPQLFEEVLGRLKAEIPVPATAPVASEEVDENLRQVYSIHPDAYDLTHTSEWEDFRSTMTEAQKGQYESDDPFEFSDLLSEYKTLQRIAASTATQTPAEELSDTLTVASGGKSVSSAPNSKGLTEQEKYNLEWDKD